MDIAYLSTLSALAGSVVGGLTSGVATWLSQANGGNLNVTGNRVIVSGYGVRKFSTIFKARSSWGD